MITVKNVDDVGIVAKRSVFITPTSTTETILTVVMVLLIVNFIVGSGINFGGQKHGRNLREARKPNEAETGGQQWLNK